MKTFFILISLIPSLAFAGKFVPSSFSANFEESLVSVTGKTKKKFWKN